MPLGQIRGGLMLTRAFLSLFKGIGFMSISAIANPVSHNQALLSLFEVNRINPISGKDNKGAAGAGQELSVKPNQPNKPSGLKLAENILKTLKDMGANKLDGVDRLTNPSTQQAAKTPDVLGALNEFVKTFMDTIWVQDQNTDSSLAQFSLQKSSLSKYRDKTESFEIGMQNLIQDVKGLNVKIGNLNTDNVSSSLLSDAKADDTNVLSTQASEMNNNTNPKISASLEVLNQSANSLFAAVGITAKVGSLETLLENMKTPLMDGLVVGGAGNVINISA
jgi:hypothetical protein